MPALLIVMVLNLTTRAMADAPATKLDERMVKTRNAAFRSAYYVLALGLVGTLAFVLATNGDEIALSRAQLLGAAWSTAVIAMFLPSAILAWTEEVIRPRPDSNDGLVARYLGEIQLEMARQDLKTGRRPSSRSPWQIALDAAESMTPETPPAGSSSSMRRKPAT